MKDTQIRISYPVYKIIMDWAKKDARTIKAQLERMVIATHTVMKDLEKVNFDRGNK